MVDRSVARPWWLLPAVVYVAMLAVFLAWSPANRAAFPLDDAWIHRVYARSFAWGHGFAYNDGVQEAGSTSPLWAMISAPVHWLEPVLGVGWVVIAVKLLGAALGALSIAAVYQLARLLSGAAWPAALAAALFACEPALLFGALSGMEVVLVVCLWLWLLVALHAERWRLAAVLLGLLPVARPEGVLLVAMCVVVLAIQRGRGVFALITRWSVLWCVLPTAAWIAFCELATGHPLPNTYYLKAAGGLGAQALATAVALLAQHGWARTSVVLIVGVIALLAWCVRHRGHRATLGLLALGSFAFVVAVVMTRSFLPLGYYWTRWTDPGVLGVAAAVALGIALGVHALVVAALARRVRLAAIGAIVVVVLAALPGLLGSIAERAERLGSDGRVIERMNVEPGRWIAAHTPAGAVIGVNDAGALRYFGGRETVDLVGLNAADIAFHRVSAEAIADRVNWIAVYPLLVKMYPSFAQFTRVQWFTIPREEYTICDCNGPTEMFVGQRGDGRRLDPDQRQAMITALRAQPPGTSVWLVASDDTAAIARADELRDVFAQAGWNAPMVQRTSVHLRKGLSLLASDNPPSPTALAVRAALVAARQPVDLAAGYRAFLARQRSAGSSTPTLELAPDQAFILAVGPD